MTANAVPQHLPGARVGRDPSRAIKRGPSRLPPEVVAATQRDRLYDGLVHTVAEKGYVNARVGDICLNAGVTRPAFYALFAGKEDAFIATYRHGTAVLWSVIEAAHESTPVWPVRVRRGLRSMLHTLTLVPSFATMAIVEIEAVGPSAREERDRLLRRFHQFFADAPPTPGIAHEELVSSVVGGVYATIHRHVAAGDFEGLPGLVPALTYFALVPFLGRRDAAAVIAEDDGDVGFVPACVPPRP